MSGLQISGIQTGIIQGLFAERFENQADYVGTRVSPWLWTDTIRGIYTVPTRASTLYTEEQGYDPMEPLSWEAPSRPVGQRYEDRIFDAERFSEHVFIDRNRALSTRAARNIDLESRAATDLVNIHRARHELFVSRLISNPANYDSSNVDSATYDAAWVKVRDAVARLGDAEDALLVMPPEVLPVMMETPSFLSSIGGGNTGLVAGYDMFRDFVRQIYGAELIVGRGRYVNNKATPGMEATSLIWDERSTDWLAVIGASSMASQRPSFSHTVAFTPTIEDPEIGQVYLDDVRDPRGTKVIAESVYKVAIGEKDMGTHLTLTES